MWAPSPCQSAFSDYNLHRGHNPHEVKPRCHSPLLRASRTRKKWQQRRWNFRRTKGSRTLSRSSALMPVFLFTIGSTSPSNVLLSYFIPLTLCHPPSLPHPLITTLWTYVTNALCLSRLRSSLGALFEYHSLWDGFSDLSNWAPSCLQKLLLFIPLPHTAYHTARHCSSLHFSFTLWGQELSVTLLGHQNWNGHWRRTGNSINNHGTEEKERGKPARKKAIPS